MKDPAANSLAQEDLTQGCLAQGYPPTAPTSPSALVIGIGNTLRGDDALGRIAAERVRQAVAATDAVKVIDQTAPTPELAAELAAVRLAVFLDASLDGPSDRVVVRRLTPGDTSAVPAHRLDPAGLLALAGQLYSRVPRTYAVTYRARTLNFADRRLSLEAEARVDELVQHTLQLLDGATS